MKESLALIEDWKQKSLLKLLKIQVLAWMPGFLAGCWNALISYRASQPYSSAQAGQTLILSLSIYVSTYLTLVALAYLPRLSYKARLLGMLSMYYLLALGLFRLSALSGDARLILFIFLLFASIFLDPPYPYIAIGLTILAFVLMAWLHLSGWIVLTAPERYNSQDLKSWVSGAVVFTIVAITTVTIVQYVFQSFARTLKNQSSIRALLHLRNNLIQQAAREENPAALLKKISEILVQAGYANLWLGLWSARQKTWREIIAIGQTNDLEQQAKQAIEAGHPLVEHSNGAFPLIYNEKCLGSIAIRFELTTIPEEQQTFLELAASIAEHLYRWETQQQREILAQTAQNLLGERDETIVWKTALATIQKILHTERCAIYEYDQISKRLSCFHFTGLSQGYIQFILTEYNRVPGGQLLNDPRPIVINDCFASPLTQSIRPILEQENIYSYIVFPLFAQKQLIGALVAYYNKPFAFSTSDIEAGQTFAHFISAAIQNARLFSENRIKSNEQAMLFVAAQEMSTKVRDFRSLLEFLAHQITQALNVTQTLIFSFDETQKNAHCLASYSLNDSSSQQISQPVQSDLKTIESIRKGYPIPRSITDPLLNEEEKTKLKQSGIFTQLILPLSWQGSLVGYLEIRELHQPRAFQQREIMLAQSLAAHVANALNAAKLFEQVERSEAYFRALTENAAEGIAVLDALGNIKYISPITEKLLGYPATTISQHRIEEKIHPQDRTLVRKRFIEVVKTPGLRQTITCRIQTKTSQWVILEATLNNLLQHPSIQGIVINFRDVTQQKQAEEQLKQAYEETLEGWAHALELRDKDTEGHTRRVTELTLKLARALKIDEDDLVHIQRGALLHDIGKVAIPDSILHKSSTLTQKEWQIMRQHPQYAYDMLKNIAYLQPALEIPYCHHEKWDGSGYPRGLKGEQIPLAARIFAVVDVWDALTSDRPYRPGWSQQKTLEYIKNLAGTHFDPAIVEIFIKLITQEE